MNKMIVGIGLALACAGARANLIQNGGFEGWRPAVLGVDPDVGGANILDVWIDGNYEVLPYTSAEGTYCIDMQGYGPGSIHQDVTTEPGQTYYLSFAMSGNPDHQQYGTVKDLLVSWGGVQVGYEIFNVAGYVWADVPWYWYQYALVATGPVTEVRFTSIIQSAMGPLLDDVVLDTFQRTLPVPGPQPTNPPGVPDGGSSAMLLGLAGFALRRLT